MAFVVYNFWQTASNTTSTTSGNSNAAILGWILGFMIVAGLAALVARPLILNSDITLQKQNAGQLHLEGLRENAGAERQALQELDFDREIGIIDEEDYRQLKEKSADKLGNLTSEIQFLERNLILNAQTTLQKTGEVKQKTGEMLKIAREKLKCSECSTYFKPGDRFCSKCSTPLPALCMHCGKEFTEDDRFCSKCGAAVNT